MSGKVGIVLGIGLTILAFIIGSFGIVVLIGVGEAANNTIAAFAAVSFPFALLAGFFAWIAPRARWAIAVALVVPITILSLMGAWSSAFMIPGALWTIGLTCAGAYLGGRLGSSRSHTQTEPPA